MMATPAQPCACTPYLNICCCGTQNGITVTQPQCQTLPDGSVVNNPAFVANLNQSFWTYKFITDCGFTTNGISSFGIPICKEIASDNITVEEKINGCGEFTPVSFELKDYDPNFFYPPEGFVYLKVETADRYDQGVCVVYRISIIGDYPEAVEPIKVKAATVVYTFSCTDCFIVPGCVQEGKLLVSKICGYTITDNQATLQYTIHVDNIGEASVDMVQFEDKLFIPTQMTIGTITVDPITLNVNTDTPGEVIISGNLGTIDPGGRVAITYSIPILSVSSPGRYVINNMATADATGTIDTASCQTTLDVIRLSADKCCSIDGKDVTFRIGFASVSDSPDVVVDITDQMKLPNGLTIQFTSFSGCEAYYSGTTNPVPLNTNISGAQTFDILCKNVLIPANGMFATTISYTLVSDSVVGTATVINSITAVTPVNADNLIYLGTQNLPATATVETTLSQICSNPC